MHVLTDSLNVTNNYFSFVICDNGYYTETNSVFTSNKATNDKASDGAVFYGTAES